MDQKIVLCGIAGVAVAVLAAIYFVQASDVTRPIGDPPLRDDCETYEGVERDACYAEAAASTGNKDYCWNIGVQDGVYSCIAAATHDTAPCDKIESEHLRQACADPVNLYWALENDEPDRCARIVSERIAEMCRESMGLVADVSECDSDACIQGYGRRNPERCAGISDEDDRYDCSIGAAKGKGDTTYCTQLQEEWKRMECLEGVLGEDNLEVCKIAYSEVYDRDECYDGIAFSYGKEEACARISDEGKRESCYEYTLDLYRSSLEVYEGY